MYGSWNAARKFFQKIKRMSEGFKSKASFCKDQDANMLTDVKNSLELWRTHFNATLNGDDTNNSANEMVGPSWSNTSDGNTSIAQPDREGVAMATSSRSGGATGVVLSKVFGLLGLIISKNFRASFLLPCISISSHSAFTNSCFFLRNKWRSSLLFSRYLSQTARVAADFSIAWYASFFSIAAWRHSSPN